VWVTSAALCCRRPRVPQGSPAAASGIRLGDGSGDSFGSEAGAARPASRPAAAERRPSARTLFNTVYLQDALDALRGEGHPVSDEQVLHLSPALIDHVNIYGSLAFDVERELGRTERRPLRRPAGATR